MKKIGFKAFMVSVTLLAFGLGMAGSAQAEEEKNRILGETKKQLEKILGEERKRSAEIRGEADAQVISISMPTSSTWVAIWPKPAWNRV